MQQLSPQRLSAGLLADFEDERELEIGRPANATEGKRVEGGDESTGKRESVMKEREELQWNIAMLSMLASSPSTALFHRSLDCLAILNACSLPDTHPLQK